MVNTFWSPDFGLNILCTVLYAIVKLFTLKQSYFIKIDVFCSDAMYFFGIFLSLFCEYL